MSCNSRIMFFFNQGEIGYEGPKGDAGEPGELVCIKLFSIPTIANKLYCKK